MPICPLASRSCWLFCCVLISVGGATAPVNSQDNSEPTTPAVTVEMWLLDALLDKMSGIGIDEIGPPGLPDSNLRDLFTSAEQARQYDDRAPGGIIALIPSLQSKGLARLVAHPKLILPSGQKGSIQTGDLKFTTTPVVKEEGRIRVEYHCDHKEPATPARYGHPSGVSQRTVDFTAELDSGKIMLVTGSGAFLSIGPKPATQVVILVRATLVQPGNAAGASATATQVAATSDTTPANEAAAKPDLKRLVIEMKVVSVNTARMKRLGLEWSQLTPDGPKQFSVENIAPLINERSIPADQLDAFLKALRQNGLARIIAEPTLITLDGRPASFSAGPTQLDLVPIVLGSGRVRLECRLTAGDAPELLAGTELELGQTCLLRNMATYDLLGPQSPDTETLILARVELLKSGQISKIVGPPTQVEVRR